MQERACFKLFKNGEWVWVFFFYLAKLVFFWYGFIWTNSHAKVFLFFFYIRCSSRHKFGPFSVFLFTCSLSELISLCFFFFLSEILFIWETNNNLYLYNYLYLQNLTAGWRLTLSWDFTWIFLAVRWHRTTSPQPYSSTYSISNKMNHGLKTSRIQWKDSWCSTICRENVIQFYIVKYIILF